MKTTVLGCLLYILVLSEVSLATKKAANNSKKVDEMEPKGPLKQAKCNFFVFIPLTKPSSAIVDADISNSKKENVTVKMVLNCPTLKIIDEPKMTYNLVPGEKKTISYNLIVKTREVHRTPEVVVHKCVITKWIENTNTLSMCHFDVSVWPYGLFDYPCNDFNESQVKFERQLAGNHVVIYKIQDSTLRLYSIYIMNLTCTPRLLLLENIEKISRLRKDTPWEIEIPENCSGILRKNYVGTCHLEIYNVCHIQKTLAVNTTIQLYDGEIDECEYLKERLGDLSHHPLAAFFGLNYVETGYLTVVILVELFVILITVIAIFVRMKKDELLHK